MMALTHRNLVKAFHYVTWGSTGGSEQMSPPSQRVRPAWCLHVFRSAARLALLRCHRVPLLCMLNT